MHLAVYYLKFSSNNSILSKLGICHLNKENNDNEKHYFFKLILVMKGIN